MTYSMMEITRSTLHSLLRAAHEQGVPNSFSPQELRQYYGGPRPLDIGRAWRYHSLTITHQLRSVGYKVDYADKRFTLTAV